MARALQPVLHWLENRCQQLDQAWPGNQAEDLFDILTRELLTAKCDQLIQLGLASRMPPSRMARVQNTNGRHHAEGGIFQRPVRAPHFSRNLLNF